MYTINFTDSSKPSITILDNGRNGPGESESSTSLTLLGKGAEDYGDELWSNMVHLLENFCSDGDIGPDNPTHGQIWYNTKDNTLKVWKVKPGNDIILPASENNPTTNTSSEYYWEPLIDASYLKSKFGDGGIIGILKSLTDGFKEPLSDEAKALIALLEKFFLPIHGGSLTDGKNGGKLYIKPLPFTTIKEVSSTYSVSPESSRAINASFMLDYVDNYVKEYLSGFGFDTSGFGKDLDSSNGSDSGEFLPLKLLDDPTEVLGNNLKLSSNIEFTKAARISTIPTIDNDIINKKYADDLFTVDTLKNILDDQTIKDKINSVVTVGGGGSTDTIDYDSLALKLSTNESFIIKVANLIKADVVKAIKADTTLTTLNVATINAEIVKYYANDVLTGRTYPLKK